MNATLSHTRTPEAAAAFGGVMDAIGGIATAVLAIIGLAGWRPELLAGVATIVFGAALLIQGGTLLSEYSQLFTTAGAMQTVSDAFGGDGMAAMFPTGVAGIGPDSHRDDPEHERAEACEELDPGRPSGHLPGQKLAGPVRTGRGTPGLRLHGVEPAHGLGDL